MTAAALVVAGAVWMLAVALFNIGVQLSAPRWVAGRSLAAFQASIAGGIAIGSWGWGRLTDAAGVETALLVSAALMLASPLLGLWLPMPRVGARNEDAEVLADPEVRLSLTGRSGPLVVEIEYRVAQDNARAFHNVMQDVQLSRQRNGAYGWSIARDIADPELWTERYHCPTWLDYLRQRNRSTQSERALHQQAIDFHLGPDPVRVRRMLERPFGSVRWKEETPDRAATEVLPVVASGARGSSTVTRGALLPVFGQDLVAGLAEPGAVLLQAGQHDLIALIHMGAAEARHIARAGIVPLLLAEALKRSERNGMTKRNLAIVLRLHTRNQLRSTRPARSRCAQIGIATHLCDAGWHNDAGDRAACVALRRDGDRQLLRGDLLASGRRDPVHHGPAAAAQLGAMLEHAGGDRGNVRDFRAAQAERVAGAHLLRFGAEGEA